MRHKQAKRLRKYAATIAPKKNASFIDRITGRIRMESKDEKGYEVFDLYTRFWDRESPRRIYRAMKKVYKNIPRTQRAKALSQLADMKVVNG